MSPTIEQEIDIQTAPKTPPPIYNKCGPAPPSYPFPPSYRQSTTGTPSINSTTKTRYDQKWAAGKITICLLVVGFVITALVAGVVTNVTRHNPSISPVPSSNATPTVERYSRALPLLSRGGDMFRRATLDYAESLHRL